MGRGDQRSRRGKISRGTYGNTRPKHAGRDRTGAKPPAEAPAPAPAAAPKEGEAKAG
ncbi:MAG: 30S ribosomal protein THX [Phycisphaeraceae bacterium]